MSAPDAAATRPPVDADLVAAARAGDAAALGVLLERRRPRLFATALRILGHGPDAEDAVQETCLVAMRHLGTLREPAAVDAWLQAVVRRACLQQRRRRRRELPAESLPTIADPAADPEQRLERLELRDWIHGALESLPESLRVTAMLRYFGSYPSYEEVAAILAVPIGTVRSRLSEARRRLSGALLASAGLIADDGRADARERERFWTDAFQDIFRRGESGVFLSHFASDLVVAWSSGTIACGREHLRDEIEADLTAGVRLDPERVMACDGIAVVEARLVNPPHAPDHCPPGIALVLFGTADRASRIHLHLSARPPRPGDA